MRDYPCADAISVDMVGTYIQGQVKTQHVTLLEQRLKVDILGPFLVLRIQLVAVVVANLHAKRPHLVGHIAPDAAHAEDSQNLAPGVVAQLRRRVAAPLAPAQGGHGGGQVAQGAEEQEDSHVGGGIVDGRRRVGDADVPVCAGGDIDLVVAGAVVADEAAGGGQGVEELGVDGPRGDDGVESAVDGDDAGKGAGGALIEEGGAVGGLGFYDVGDLGEGRPVVMGAGWSAGTTDYDGRRG